MNDGACSMEFIFFIGTLEEKGKVPFGGTSFGGENVGAADTEMIFYWI